MRPKKINSRAMFSILSAAATWLLLAPQASGQRPDTLKQDVIVGIDSIEPVIEEIAIKLWDYAELALAEARSADLLARKLTDAGFTVESNVADMPTAFVATYGSGTPVIGILAEYDALPGVGNQAVAERKPRADGITSGHGCGHNLFGAASVGGAITLKQLLQAQHLSGTIKLFGTPAEETVVGKVYMAKAGVFDGLDAVLEWHPGQTNEVRNQTGRAMNSFEVEFFGQSAHGSADPWNGRSALDAVEMMNYGVNLMREHVKPTARIHYVITAGGDAPNVVPDYARVWYYVRDINRTEVGKYYDRILKIAEGAALATETTHKVHLITGVYEYLLNRPLQEALQKNLELVGAPKYTEAEQEFARSLQRITGKEEKGFNDKIKPLPDKPGEVEGGSTDVADVSWIVPTAGFRITTAAEDAPWHSWATTACSGTPAGRKGAIVAAKVIATTGVDILTNPELVKQAKAFFAEATKGKTYQSPVPANQKPPSLKEQTR